MLKLYHAEVQISGGAVPYGEWYINEYTVTSKDVYEDLPGNRSLNIINQSYPQTVGIESTYRKANTAHSWLTIKILSINHELDIKIVGKGLN